MCIVFVTKNISLCRNYSNFYYSDEILNAMGSARLEIMDERDEDKEDKTVTQQKVLTCTCGLKLNVTKCCVRN